MPSSFPMPIIIGSPRSGTTLLRLMMDAHPKLAIPPETGFFSLIQAFRNTPHLSGEDFFQKIVSFPADAPAWDDYHIPKDEFYDRIMKMISFRMDDGFRLFYAMYAARFGKSRWGDKTPIHTHYLLDIQDLLPETHFIHIIRDGRDVALSLREQWFSPGHDMTTQAKFWMDNVNTAHAQGLQCKHYLEIRFEDLILQFEPTLRRICKYIELDFHADMLRYYEHAPQRIREHLARRKLDGTLLVSQSARYKQQSHSMLPPDLSKISTWKKLLTHKEIDEFEVVAGATLQRYGYSVSKQRSTS